MSRKAFYLDMLERAVWTGIQAGLAVVIETGIDDFSGWAYVRNAAILAVIKALVVNKLPWTASNSASTLPEEVDPPNNEFEDDTARRKRLYGDGGAVDWTIIAVCVVTTIITIAVLKVFGLL